MLEVSENPVPYGYVYEIVNKINGKTYVGARKISLDKSWRQYMGSGTAIKSAIKKYGTENFVKKFITTGPHVPRWRECLAGNL